MVGKNIFCSFDCKAYFESFCSFGVRVLSREGGCCGNGCGYDKEGSCWGSGFLGGCGLIAGCVKFTKSALFLIGFASWDLTEFDGLD